MIRINLLPVRAEKKRESLRQHTLVAVGCVLVLAAVIGSVHLMLVGDVSDMRTRIAQTKAEISRLQAVIGEVKEFKKKKKDLEDKIQVIAQLEQRQRGPVRVLHELAKIIPDKVWIERMKDTGGALSVEGYAVDNQTIARFMTDLESSPWFEAVRLEVTKQVTKAGVSLKSFSLKASVAYPKAG